jgi:hypothetical protein
LLLAQSAIFLFKPVVWAPIAVILSSIFYHTLGTVEKIVLKIRWLLRSANLKEFNKISLQRWRVSKI